jgi:hypothetical protein
VVDEELEAVVHQLAQPLLPGAARHARREGFADGRVWRRADQIGGGVPPDEDVAMAATGIDLQVPAGQPLRHLVHEGSRLGIGDIPGRRVEETLAVSLHEVESERDVVPIEVDLQARRLEGARPRRVLMRRIAQKRHQGRVAGHAVRSHGRADGPDPPLACEVVEVRRARRLERRPPLQLRQRLVGRAVQDEEYELHIM